MTLAQRIHEVAKVLRESSIVFAFAGGLVASLYRKEERTTRDLDLLILAGENTEKVAEQLLTLLNLNVQPVRQAELEGGPLHSIKMKRSPVWLLSGQPKSVAESIPVDFILPGMPWFEKALQRAQFNLINFGVEKIPCLTVEDLVLSKLYALKNRSDRFKDLDDLQNIFSVEREWDLSYLRGEMLRLNLTLPKMLKKSISEGIRKALSP